MASRKIKASNDAIVFQHTQTFDELGRLLRQIGAANQTTTYAYEKNDNLKSVTDPRSGVYSYAYDSLNRLIRETDQESSQVNLTLDGQGETTTYKDPRNLETSYVRNGFGEIIRQSSPDSGVTTHIRDARGLVTQTTDARGVVTDMTYDAAGRMLTRSFPAATAENVTYAYDSISAGNFGLGRLTSMTHEGGSIAWTYDARGNVTQEARTIAGAAQAVQYTYDAADNLTQITYPSGRQVSYTRDTSGRITAVKTRAVSSDPWSNVLTGIVYQPQSRLVQSATFANGVNDWNTYTQDYELDVLRCDDRDPSVSRSESHRHQKWRRRFTSRAKWRVTIGARLYDGPTTLINRAHTRTDALNLTNIFDNVTPANNASLWYSPANRLQNADGPWGSESFYYDGVGNRIEQRATPPGGSQTISTLGYPATSNRVTQITQNATTVRAIGYDAAGNITSDNRLGSTYAYTYNKANRLKTVSYEGNLKGTYTYNGLHQLITRVVTNSGSLDGTAHYVHDRSGNVIAELNAAGAVAREYIWLPEAEIAPTAASRATIDRPIAVVDGVGGASPATYYVHADHLHRPLRMTNATKSIVWSAEYQPWGAVQSLSGALTLDLRFPGQWFQLEAGLHYNWHRHYDASLGRYTQPDPLGFVDGPSVYGYAGGSPLRYADPSGLFSNLPQTKPPGGSSAIQCGLKNTWDRCKDILKGANKNAARLFLLCMMVITGEDGPTPPPPPRQPPQEIQGPNRPSGPPGPPKDPPPPPGSTHDTGPSTLPPAP